jgi:hypothetical protein
MLSPPPMTDGDPWPGLQDAKEEEQMDIIIATLH